MPTGVYPRKKKVLDPDAVESGIDVDAAEAVPGDKKKPPSYYKPHVKKKKGMTEEEASQLLEGFLGLVNMIYTGITKYPAPEYDPMAKEQIAHYASLTSEKYDLPDIPPEYMLLGWTAIGVGVPIYMAEQERKNGGSGKRIAIAEVFRAPDAPRTPPAEPERPLSDFDLAGTARPDGSVHSPANGAASEVQSAAAGDGLREARVG
jgi:hypothetical protein